MQHQPTTTATAIPEAVNPWSPAFWSPDAWFPQASLQAGSGRDVRTKVTAKAAPYAGLLTIMQAFNPMLKAMAQSNSEILGLMTSRAKAMSEVPVKISQCTAPQDLASLQLQFWQTACHEHADVAKRVIAAWGPVAPMAGILAKGIGEAFETSAAVPPAAVRDMMTFTKDAEQESEPPQSPSLPLAAKRPLGERRSVA